MADDDKILALASDGKPDGGCYAVTANGHLISAKVLKDGMRWATAGEVAAVAKIEADRKAKELAAVKSAGGPLGKGG